MNTFTNFIKSRLKPVKDGNYIHVKTCQLLFGLSEEVGEVSQLFSKRLLYNQPINLTDLKSELGDVIHYAVAIGAVHGLTLEDILKHNIKKLSSR